MKARSNSGARLPVFEKQAVVTFAPRPDFPTLQPLKDKRRELAKALVELDKEILAETKRLQDSLIGPNKVLSPRQLEVYNHLVNRLSNKEIATQMGVSVRTVKFHVFCLFKIFGVQSRLQLRGLE